MSAVVSPRDFYASRVPPAVFRLSMRESHSASSSYRPFVNTILYKPIVGIYPNLHIGAVGNKDAVIRF